MLKISLPTTLVDTPLELNVKYKKDDVILFSGLTFYRNLVGSFVCLTITRPNISHVINL